MKTVTAIAIASLSLVGCADSTRLHKPLGGHGGLRLGAIADTNGATAETMARLGGFVEQLHQRGVDAMVALGDLGDSEDEVAAVLTALGRAGVPVLALPGERESETVFKTGVQKARAAGVDVVDLVANPLIDTGEIDIVSVPGYPVGGDLNALEKRLEGRWRPLLLLSHAPPRGEGPHAVDWSQGKNVGEPALLDLINAVYPNAALFAHADESGGRVQRSWINIGGVAAGMAARVELVHNLPRAEFLP